MAWYGWLGALVLLVDQALLPLADRASRPLVHPRDVDGLHPPGRRLGPPPGRPVAAPRPAPGGALHGDRLDSALAALRGLQRAPPELGVLRRARDALGRRPRLCVGVRDDLAGGLRDGGALRRRAACPRRTCRRRGSRSRPGSGWRWRSAWSSWSCRRSSRPRCGPWTFGFVWLGFVLLLDPLNARAGRPSFLGSVARRRSAIHGPVARRRARVRRSCGSSGTTGRSPGGATWASPSSPRSSSSRCPSPATWGSRRSPSRSLRCIISSGRWSACPSRPETDGRAIERLRRTRATPTERHRGGRRDRGEEASGAPRSEEGIEQIPRRRPASRPGRRRPRRRRRRPGRPRRRSEPSRPPDRRARV